MSDSPPASIVPLAPEHHPAVSALLESLGWDRRYVDGQRAALDHPAEDDVALVAIRDLEPVGVAMVRFERWNALGQIHVLAVVAAQQRQGIGSLLVAACEREVAMLGGRGIFADTPMTNGAARAFYAMRGFIEAYRMPRFYADDEDGVTVQTFFS